MEQKKTSVVSPWENKVIEEKFGEIFRTNDYDRFELLHYNQDAKKVKTLKTSMTKYGFLSEKPIHVIYNIESKMLMIKSGNHRFVVAKRLGIPIPYQIISEIIPVENNIFTMSIFDKDKKFRSHWLTKTEYFGDINIEKLNKVVLKTVEYFREEYMKEGIIIMKGPNT